MNGKHSPEEEQESIRLTIRKILQDEHWSKGRFTCGRSQNPQEKRIAWYHPDRGEVFEEDYKLSRDYHYVPYLRDGKVLWEIVSKRTFLHTSSPKKSLMQSFKESLKKLWQR